MNKSLILKLICTVALNEAIVGTAFAEARNAYSCGQVDVNQTFSDGIPICPDSVRTESVWSLLQCAYGKSKKLKDIKTEDVNNLAALFDQLQSHVDRSRSIENFAMNPIAKNADIILQKADAVGLQACRSVDISKKDSFLLFYTKPGILDNTGGFFGIREVKSSRIVVLLPHDDTDGYAVSGKEAFSQTNAFGFLSNTNDRKRFGGRANDWSHEKENWGFKFFQNFNRLSVNAYRNKPFFMNMHGQADTSSYLSYAGPERPNSLEAYNTAVSEVLPGLERKKFTVHYIIRFEIPHQSDRYIQSELPAARHIKGTPILNIVKKLEMPSVDNPDEPRFPFIWGNPGETE